VSNRATPAHCTCSLVVRTRGRCFCPKHLIGRLARHWRWAVVAGDQWMLARPGPLLVSVCSLRSLQAHRMAKIRRMLVYMGCPSSRPLKSARRSSERKLSGASTEVWLRMLNSRVSVGRHDFRPARVDVRSQAFRKRSSRNDVDGAKMVHAADRGCIRSRACCS
jgi:hypothetical protein